MEFCKAIALRMVKGRQTPLALAGASWPSHAAFVELTRGHGLEPPHCRYYLCCFEPCSVFLVKIGESSSLVQ